MRRAVLRKSGCVVDVMDLLRGGHSTKLYEERMRAKATSTSASQPPTSCCDWRKSFPECLRSKVWLYFRRRISLAPVVKKLRASL